MESKVPTRRELGQMAAGLALASQASTAGAASPLAPYRADKPLHKLQQSFMDRRFGMFIHYNMATYQDREWGDPTGPLKAFDPTALDTDQWARAAVSANMTYGCLTTKHHDGFCLWPTATGSASIKDTPRQIDVVGAYADSFRKHGLRVGLYYSILSRRDDIQHFNVTPAKIQLIKQQLTELLTRYGEIDILIFDGWDAPWSRIPYSEVPFAEIYALIKKLQPNCLISELNASEYPSSALYYSDIKAYEQNAGQALPGDSVIPSQSCVTLTANWFWKEGDEKRPLKPVSTVVDEWLVPQNKQHCNVILNAAPTREGRFAPNVVERLAEIGRAWRHPGAAPAVDPAIVITTPNLATGRPIRANWSADTNGPDQANDGSFKSAWRLDDGVTDGWLEIDFDHPTDFNLLTFVEAIGTTADYNKSRITAYAFERWTGSGWEPVAEGASDRQVRLHPLKRMRAERLRLRLTGSLASIADVGVYDEPRTLAR
jgi:alpha-L-fucosidase